VKQEPDLKLDASDTEVLIGEMFIL
jgi:hypothetical protein